MIFLFRELFFTKINAASVLVESIVNNKVTITRNGKYFVVRGSENDISHLTTTQYDTNILLMFVTPVREEV